jgi:hypothetical protein
MKNRPARIAASSTGLIAVAFLLASAATVSAQGPPRSVDHTDPAKARFEETNRRELQLRNNGPTAKATVDPKRVAAIAAQVKEDFERLLTLHNNVAHAVTGSQPLDYAFVSDATAEIKKRASRLQTTLALQRLDADQRDSQKPASFKDAEVKEALIKLCRRIESFVQNPIIATPGTVDLQQLARARRDLQSVIELGDHIRKAAERLKKANP